MREYMVASEIDIIYIDSINISPLQRCWISSLRIFECVVSVQYNFRKIQFNDDHRENIFARII